MQNRSTKVVDRLYYNVGVEAVDRLADDALYFHAQFRRTTTRAGQPVVVLEAEGRGHYVGTLLAMQPLHGRSLWYLEGNERVFVDGERTPSVLGTGTEDYFSSGWYFDTGPYAADYHGAPITATLSGRSSACRWHIEDPLPFTRHRRNAARAGPRLLRGRDALVERRAAALVGREPSRRPAHAAAARAVGRAVRDRRLLHPRAGLRDRPRAVNGTALPTTANGYAPAVEPTGPVSLGRARLRARLRAGANELTLEMVGRDPRAHGYSDGYLVGLDAIELRP